MADEEQLSLFPSATNRWWERMVVVIPSVAVIGLAALYTVGALVKAAQLEGAGLKISDTLSLLPLETILGAGIGVVIRSAVALIVIGLIALGTPALMRRIIARVERRASAHEKKVNELKKRTSALDESSPGRDAATDRLAADVQRQRRRYKIRLRILAGIVVILSVVTPMFFNPVLAIAFCASLLGIVAARALGLPIIRIGPYYLMAQYVVILGAYVVSAFVYPTPLPEAKITVGKTAVSGKLVAITDSAWYLANGRRVEAVPVRRMDRATFVSQERVRPASLGTRLLRSLGLE